MNFCVTLIKRIIGAASSAAIAATFVPEIAMPVMALDTRVNILNSDVSENTRESETQLPSLEDYPHEVYEFGGHKYAFVRTNVLWSEAKELCESWGGYYVC